MHRFAGLISQNADDLAVMLSLENGKTLAEAKGEVEYSAGFITGFAEETIQSYEDIILSQNARNTNFII